jgi:RNA polymerase sigma-70 factor (ECF subfamily)
MEIEEYIVADDAALVDMVLGGDNRAFEHLFDRYSGALHRIYLARTGGNGDDTNDLIQEIFVKAYLKLAGYDRRYAFGQWIYTIARNTFIDYVRKRRDDLSIDNTRGEYIRQPVSQTPNPEERIIRAEQRGLLEEHLGRMSPKYRKLIELRFFKDLSYDEIAEQLELPLGTVKTRIHRARTQLCGYITKSGIE